MCPGQLPQLLSDHSWGQQERRGIKYLQSGRLNNFLTFLCVAKQIPQKKVASLLEAGRYALTSLVQSCVPGEGEGNNCHRAAQCVGSPEVLSSFAGVGEPGAGLPELSVWPERELFYS